MTDHTTPDERPGMVQLSALPGQPAVPFEAVYPLLSTAAQTEIELRATQLVASQVLTERAQLESHIEMLTNQVAEADENSN